MICIIDYDAGNLNSVCNALNRLGAQYLVSDNPSEIAKADKIILPGVGNAARAVESLRDKGLAGLVRNSRKPVLGICVGLQIMCRRSEEDNALGLGIFDCEVRRFEASAEAKVPHMGWNSIANLESKLFKGIEENTSVYFVHSYFPELCTDTVATCRHAGVLFSAALKYENFYGTQFHPEKSSSAGSRILENFLAL